MQICFTYDWLAIHYSVDLEQFAFILYIRILDRNQVLICYVQSWTIWMIAKRKKFILLFNGHKSTTSNKAIEQ